MNQRQWLSTIVEPLVLEPAPLVARSRSRTVAKVDSITPVARRRFHVRQESRNPQGVASCALGYSTVLSAGFMLGLEVEPCIWSGAPRISCKVRWARS